jgi:glucose/arabinose dehydrogenase
MPTTTTSAAPTTTGPTTTTTSLPALTALAYEPVAEGLSRPLLVTSPPGDPRLFIVERGGRILVHDGQLQDQPFLDLDDVVSDSGIEMGLLGIAFHPDFAANGRFFVYYTDVAEDTHLVEYRVGGDGLGDPESAIDVITFDQPTSRHNGGNLQFGPDGYLYLSLGEGGEAGRNAQNPATLLSAILRLDVDQPDPGKPYGIPPDNPFADGVDGAPEVWAYGLRNPWRYDIDPESGLLYIADVGHEEWEEINVVDLATGGGSNFGWLIMEANECFAISDCDPSEFVNPIVAYDHSEGCSVTGGYVYRGSAIPELAGRYLYSDWCGGWLRSFLYENGQVVEEVDWTDQVGIPGQINSFGEDASGELYVTTWEGDVLRLVAIREGG